MIINPDLVVFEDPDDLIDYVTRGIPPTKKRYQHLKTSMASASAPVVDENGKCSQNITTDTFNYRGEELTKEQYLEKILDRTYENQCRNRNFTIGALAGSLALGLATGFAVGNSHGEKKALK